MSVAPTASANARPRQDLLGAYHEFDPASHGLRAREIFPSFRVAKRDGRFGVVPREVFLQHINTKVAATAESPTLSYSLEDDAYQLITYRAKQLGLAEHMEIYGDWFDFDQINTAIARHLIDLDLERDAAALAFSDTFFDTTTGKEVEADNEWDDAAAGTPITDVMAAHELFSGRFPGIKPNAVIMSEYLHRKLGLNDEVLYGLRWNDGAPRAGMIKAESIAALFEVDNIIIVPGVVNGAVPDESGTYTTSRIWAEDRVLLTRISSGGRNLNEACLGRLFDLADGVTLRSRNQDDPEGRWVEAKDIRQAKVFSDPVGVMITGLKSA